MEIVRLDPKTVALHGIAPFDIALLRQIPLETDPGDDETAKERLFSKPVEGEGRQGDALNEEWKHYVEPGLRHLFQSANETVSQDLKNITKTKGEEESYTLHIPIDHLEQWLSSLNQANLVMAAKNAFTAEEIDGYPPIINSTRDMNLLQIHFYAWMQDIFIHEMGY